MLGTQNVSRELPNSQVSLHPQSSDTPHGQINVLRPPSGACGHPQVKIRPPVSPLVPYLSWSCVLILSVVARSFVFRSGSNIMTSHTQQRARLPVSRPVHLVSEVG